MKTSELISRLQAAVAEHGDLEVYYHGDYRPLEVEHTGVTVVSLWGEQGHDWYDATDYVDHDFPGAVVPHDCMFEGWDGKRYFCRHSKSVVIH